MAQKQKTPSRAGLHFGSSQHKICPQCSSASSERERFCSICRFPTMLVAEKYRFVKKIAEGGFSQVYLARHIHLGPEADRVIKIIEPKVFEQPSMLKRFYREIQVTSQLSQKNKHIVRIYDDFGEIPGLGHFYVMEHLQGSLLSDYMQSTGYLLPWENLCCLLSQICSTIQSAHEKDILHRDLKPENIFLIDQTEQNCFIKIFDFGIAKALTVQKDESARLTQNLILGTPHYMAPEQVSGGELDVRTDLYAIGMIAYELLVGRLPFRVPVVHDNVIPVLAAQLNEKPRSLREIAPDRGISKEVEDVVLRALEKKPHDRFSSVGEFRRVFLDAVESSGVLLNSSNQSVSYNSVKSVDSIPLESPHLGIEMLSTPSLQTPRPTVAYVENSSSNKNALLPKPPSPLPTSSSSTSPSSFLPQINTSKRKITNKNAREDSSTFQRTNSYQSELHSVWEEASKIPGFVATGLFSKNGLLLDGYSTHPDFQMELAAGTFIMIIEAADQAGNSMDIGLSKELQIDYHGIMIFLRSLGQSEGVLIGLAVQKGAPLGRIRLGLDLLERAILARSK